jgi:hypothetical protein
MDRFDRIAEVISPEELREEIKGRLWTALQNYQPEKKSS